MNYNYQKRSSKKFSGNTKAAVLKSEKRGYFELVTPWSAVFLDEFKSSIQPSSRRWDMTSKRWIISEIVLEDVVRIMKKHFDEVTTDLIQPEQTGNLFEQVFMVVPKEHTQKIYMALAQAIHPDHGGSVELMKQLNDAYGKVK